MSSLSSTPKKLAGARKLKDFFDKQTLECFEVLTFGELDIDDKFIAFPLPGDNSGHGGYLGKPCVFSKLTRLSANNIRDNSVSNFSDDMAVLRLDL